VLSMKQSDANDVAEYERTSDDTAAPQAENSNRAISGLQALALPKRPAGSANRQEACAAWGDERNEQHGWNDARVIARRRVCRIEGADAWRR
jgi:hypothetical protein